MSAEVRVKVTAFVTDTVPIRAACLLQRYPEFFKKAIPLPGASLALVGCNTGSCTLVGLFTWAQWAGELYLIPGRRIGLASFLGFVAGQVVLLVLVPVGHMYVQTVPGPLFNSRCQADRHEAHAFDRYVT